MAAITLISESQAIKGGRFHYLGPQPECAECKLKSVCFNLEQGTLYEITAVRGQGHDCILNEDRVRVVEIKKIAQRTVVLKKSAIEGSVITFQEPECGRMDCVTYQTCHPSALKNGKKYTVIEINGSANCPVGQDLVLVLLF
jgi:uncharacterized protein (UPF0179 family)